MSFLRHFLVRNIGICWIFTAKIILTLVICFNKDPYTSIPVAFEAKSCNALDSEGPLPNETKGSCLLVWMEDSGLHFQILQVMDGPLKYLILYGVNFETFPLRSKPVVVFTFFTTFLITAGKNH